MVQDADTWGDVSILVNVKYADPSMWDTDFHKWHVHTKRLLPYEAYMGNNVCDEAGGHFNPFDGDACTTDADDWADCEMGDLAGTYAQHHFVCVYVCD